MDGYTTAAAFGVGITVGMTGIGGGALMTPILVLLLGVPANLAVGTDLLFASVTKVFGVAIHRRHGTIDWEVVRRLALGSIPAALLTLVTLALLDAPETRGGLMMTGLGSALAITALGLALKGRLHGLGRYLRDRIPVEFKRWQPAMTVAAGAAVGGLVALTSVGAGALGTVALVYLYPYRLSGAKLVGTDLAHAIPLALAAGAGHLALGNVDFLLLSQLLLGSIPGVILGANLSARLPETLVRRAVALVLMLAAFRLLAG